MAMAGDVFSATQTDLFRSLGLSAAGFILGVGIFSWLWQRLRRRLQTLLDQIALLSAEHDARRSEAPIASVMPPHLAIHGWAPVLDEAQRRLLIITDAMRAERDAALQANQSKTRFLAAASHDLRQPLQALGLFVAALAQRAPDELKGIVGKIEASLEAFEHLLEGLLDISRLDAGAVEAHSVAFPLQKLFARMALEFDPLAERKHLSLRFVATRAVLHSDPDLLDRVLRNLLANAVHYTEKGGIVVGVRHRGPALRIEVWDSGTGIAPGDQQAIFREFHQLAARSGAPGHGLGLGLAIVERLVDLLGGAVELHSIPGRGSVFAVVLPMHRAADARADNIDLPAPRHRADTSS